MSSSHTTILINKKPMLDAYRIGIKNKIFRETSIVHMTMYRQSNNKDSKMPFLLGKSISLFNFKTKTNYVYNSQNFCRIGRITNELVSCFLQIKNIISLAAFRNYVHLEDLQLEFSSYLRYTCSSKRSQILLNNQYCSENILRLHAVGISLHCLDSNLLFLRKENINLAQKNRQGDQEKKARTKE